MPVSIIQTIMVTVSHVSTALPALQCHPVQSSTAMRKHRIGASTEWTLPCLLTMTSSSESKVVSLCGRDVHLAMFDLGMIAFSREKRGKQQGKQKRRSWRKKIACIKVAILRKCVCSILECSILINYSCQQWSLIPLILSIYKMDVLYCWTKELVPLQSRVNLCTPGSSTILPRCKQ